jgi:predicted metal-dependent hydrolase
MTSFHDSELGEINVRRSKLSRHVRFKVGTDGKLVASVPPLTPLFLLKQSVRGSRKELQELLRKTPSRTYSHGDKIGQSHTLSFVAGPVLRTRIVQRTLIVDVPDSSASTSQQVQSHIREAVIKLLRKEAKVYLDVRLETLAKRHGFRYERIRYTHAETRWGSCSSSGTISLNIALMSLPLELIDYVLFHELSHTRQMNHSPAFWQEVAALDPQYKLHRRILKTKTPNV